MPRKRPDSPGDQNSIDANQVVAFNFRLAREMRGWTQEETALQLERHLGQRLKKTSISAIERSVESDRRRVFTAQEIVAFSLAFDVPFVWFLIPPPDNGIKLEGLDSPVADLWRVVVGTDEQMPVIRERLRELAEGNPDEARKAGVSALTFDPNVTWDHYQHQRLDSLLDLVTEKRDLLDDLFGQMKDLVETYESRSMQHSIMGDMPRRAYRRTAEILLGQKVWELIHAETKNELPGPVLFDLINYDDVPWEELIDTEKPDVRSAILNFASAIEPDMAQYLRSRISRDYEEDSGGQ